MQSNRRPKQKHAAHPLNQFLLDHYSQLRNKALSMGRENQAFAYRKVIASLQTYPIPLICQEQCLTLEGVGGKIGAAMGRLIFQRYKQYRIDDCPVEDGKDESEFAEESCSEKSSLIGCSVSFRSKPKPKSCKRYSPEPGSGAWNILKVMEKADREGTQSLKKDSIKKELRKQSQKASVQSLKSLVKHGFLAEQEEEYSLTMQGRSQLLRSRKQSPRKPARIKDKREQQPPTSLPPDAKLILLVDNREMRSQKDRYFATRLEEDYGITTRLQNLAVGDFLWVADFADCEWTTGHVLERKAIDDLASSLIDGRYREQKHRLQATNLSCFYMVEGPLDESRLSNAAISTGLGGFTVIRSEGIKETCSAIAALSKSIQSLISSGKGSSFCTFEDFQKRNTKSTLTVNAQLSLMLREIEGVGKEAALALASHFSSWGEFYNCLKALSPEQRYALVSDTSKGRRKLPFSVIERVARTILGE